jgi:hypothetical protein
MASHLEHLRRELEDAIDGASEAALAQAPAGKWNAAQILEHLFLTYKNTNYGLRMCLEKGATLATSTTLKHRLGTLLVVNIGFMPKGREAPKRAVPQGIAPAGVRSMIFAEIEKMESGFADCQRRFGPGTKLMDHPFLGPLTANQWRKFHLVHGQHHAAQIRERLKIR